MTKEYKLEGAIFDVGCITLPDGAIVLSYSFYNIGHDKICVEYLTPIVEEPQVKLKDVSSG